MEMATVAQLVAEVEAVSIVDTLRRAAQSDSMGDVIGVHEAVLRARGLRWTPEVEAEACAVLRERYAEVDEAAP